MLISVGFLSVQNVSFFLSVQQCVEHVVSIERIKKPLFPVSQAVWTYHIRNYILNAHL